MNVAIVTVGDEILAGSTNHQRVVAGRADHRARQQRRSDPDDSPTTANSSRSTSPGGDAFDAVIVTGGIGGTPDDVTVEAVADGLEREFVVHGEIKERLVEKAAAFRDENPEMVEEYDLQLDIDAAASIPEGATPIVVDEGGLPAASSRTSTSSPASPTR